jgi:hypothetical protein
MAALANDIYSRITDDSITLAELEGLLERRLKARKQAEPCVKDGPRSPAAPAELARAREPASRALDGLGDGLEAVVEEARKRLSR